MQNNNKNNIKHNSQLIQIGFLLILFGTIICGSQFFYKQKIKAQQEMDRRLFEAKGNETEVKEEKIESAPVEETNKEEEKEEVTPIHYNFIGMLEIPKISLKQGFVSKDDIHNNVDENITILKDASYPDQDKGNFILAAHSGTGAIAYFNELYHLQESDTIYVYYKNKKYAYRIARIYKQDKTGSIHIYRDPSLSTLTLITCTNDNEKTQTVYIATLTSVQDA